MSTNLSLLLGLFILFQINLILVLVILLVERIVVVVRVAAEPALATAFKVGKRLGKDIVFELLPKVEEIGLFLKVPKERSGIALKTALKVVGFPTFRLGLSLAGHPLAKVLALFPVNSRRVHFEIMFLVEFAELISDGTVSGSGLDTLLEGVLFREGLVGKVRVLLKVEYKLIRSKVVYILLELNVLQERKGMLVKLGSDVRGHKLVRKQNNQPELIDILDLGPEVSEVILGLLGVESLVLDILVALLDFELVADRVRDF